jgi:predicted transcriptional regulator
MSTKTIVILKGVHIDHFEKFATMLADEPNINIIVLIFSENTIFE